MLMYTVIGAWFHVDERAEWVDEDKWENVDEDTHGNCTVVERGGSYSPKSISELLWSSPTCGACSEA